VGRVVAGVLLAAGCGGDAVDDAEGAADAGTDSGAMEATAMAESANPLVTLLESGHPVFGIFPGDQTREGGLLMGANQETDFVFYSLESGPFDIPGMLEYKAGLVEGTTHGSVRPMVLRIPPIMDGTDEAMQRTQEGLEAGVVAIVYPHVVSGADAQVSVEAMGPELWPGNPQGSLVNMLIVEDQQGVANVDEIMATPGVSVVFAGPGDLSRAYDRDMEAVEQAIQTILASCKAHDVPCGITAGAADIATRLEQGFRVIIVTEPAALAVGLQASGRAG